MEYTNLVIAYRGMCTFSVFVLDIFLYAVNDVGEKFLNKNSENSN